MVLHLHDSDRKRDRHNVVGEARTFERGLDLIGRCVLHKPVFQRSIPDAVVYLGDFYVTGLEFVKALIEQLGVGVALGLCRADEFKRTVEAEGGGRRRGRKYKITA